MTIEDLDKEAKLIIEKSFKEGWSPKDLTIIAALLLSFSTFVASKKGDI